MGFNLFPRRQKRLTSAINITETEVNDIVQEAVTHSDQPALYIPNSHSLADTEANEPIFNSGFSPTRGVTQLSAIKNPVELPAILSNLQAEIIEDDLSEVFQKFRSAAQIAVMLDQHVRTTSMFRIAVSLPKLNGDINCELVQADLVQFGKTQNSKGAEIENLVGVDVFRLKTNTYVLQFCRNMNADSIVSCQGPNALSRLDIMYHNEFRDQAGDPTNLTIALNAIEGSLPQFLNGDTFVTDLLAKPLEICIPTHLDHRQVSLLNKVRLLDVYLTILQYNENLDGAKIKFCLKSKRG